MTSSVPRDLRLSGHMYISSMAVEFALIDRTSSWISWNGCERWAKGVHDIFEATNPIRTAVRVEQELYGQMAFYIQWHSKLGGHCNAVMRDDPGDPVTLLVNALENTGLPFLLRTQLALRDGEVRIGRDTE